MSVSQFTKYTSSDVSGPGALTGATGILLALLDACLVNGYTGKTAAGWTKPFANASSIGCYKQGAGAGLGIVINDAGPNGTSTFKEAWATGWEVVAGVGSPVGTGTGQFPTPAQLGTTGQVVIRKSTTADSTARQWELFADASTFYLFVQTGDTSTMYYAFGFGDFYSLNSTNDAYRVFISGGSTANSATVTNYGMDITSSLNAAVVGMYCPRAFGGTGTSVALGKHGDTAKANASATLLGGVATPNGSDASFYLSPVWITESANSNIRGQARGFYHLLHAIAGFTDGQTFNGAGAFAGKTFQVIKESGNLGMFCIETSNTVQTN
jgi:hypothetical protein